MSDNESKVLVGRIGMLSAFSTVNVNFKKLFINSSADSLFNVVIEPSNFLISCVIFYLLLDKDEKFRI